MRQYWFIPVGVILLLLIAGFFVGWTQLSLVPDTYGVVFTRAHGFEKEIVRPQGISWRWERLIPGALTLYRYSLLSQKADLSIKGCLPSGEVYGGIAPEKPDFSFEIRLSVLFRLNPEALPQLADSSHLRPDGLGDFYKTLIDAMQGKAMALSLSADGESTRGREPAEIADFIGAELPRFFPSVEFITVAPAAVRVPDFTLYSKLRDTYLGMSAVREEALKASAARIADQEAEQNAAVRKQERTIAVLEKYGELLDKHPALIKFLFIAAAKGFTAQDIQNFDILEKLGR